MSEQTEAKKAAFLEQYGVKDHPDMDEGQASLLMDDHFYYIDDYLQGFFIKKDISVLTEIEEYIHEELREEQE